VTGEFTDWGPLAPRRIVPRGPRPGTNRTTIVSFRTSNDVITVFRWWTEAVLDSGYTAVIRDAVESVVLDIIETYDIDLNLDRDALTTRLRQRMQLHGQPPDQTT